MRTVYFNEGTAVISDELWMEITPERFWNAPEALILMTPEKYEQFKQRQDVLWA
jgi:hypothetical protein